jgi:asparagine synthase (glutamine-hydrolysing)
MCGIWAIINDSNVNTIFQNFNNIKCRGPDYSSLQSISNTWIGFHRLSIVDVSFTSNQPFVICRNKRTFMLICNGEIYNYLDLIEEYELKMTKKSDCLSILELYIEYPELFCRLFNYKIKGEFAFIIFEFNEVNVLQKIVAGRDQIGIRPLYYNLPQNSDTMIFSSEIKGTKHFSGYIEEFPPGHIMMFDITNKINVSSVYKFKWIYTIFPDILCSNEQLLLQVRDSVVASVKRRLRADRPIVFLLSGGVDSSLVAGIAAKEFIGKPINTFCCGMTEGSDLIYARKVAAYIGSNHTEVIFTIEEALDSIVDVIYTVETWDTTTIRASVGQYLVSKYISMNTSAKVVLVGEGPDEVCSSYLFNWYAPGGHELHTAAKDYVEEIHYFDSKRADRCLSRWGLEGRVPLLDPEFCGAYWKIPVEKRMPTYKNMEKWWLREAFAETEIIPDEVLWRKKEAFSDGISDKKKSWFQIIQDHCDKLVTDIELENAHIVYPFCTPVTKEAYYYRKIFCEKFGENRQTVIPHYWQPRWNSSGNLVTNYIDPSARILDIY